jgi:hypothetical protein
MRALTKEDPRRIPVPTLLIAGEADYFNGVKQARAMRRCIPQSGLPILNHAELDGMATRRVQYTRPAVGRWSFSTSWAGTGQRPSLLRPAKFRPWV